MAPASPLLSSVCLGDEIGGRLGSSLRLGAGVRWSAAPATDRPSKCQPARDEPPDWVAGGRGHSLDAESRPVVEASRRGQSSRLVSPHAGKVEPPIPRRAGGRAYASARRPSETTEQGVLPAPRA